jgi:hypothetical protein
MNKTFSTHVARKSPKVLNDGFDEDEQYLLNKLYPKSSLI